MNDFAVFMAIIGAGTLVLLVPVFIAFYRRHPNRWAIFIVTVVFGGTLIGWLGALVWSLHGFHRSNGPTTHGGESGLNLFANDPQVVRIADGPDRDTVNARPLQVNRDVAWASDQLERLGRLREQGHLDGAEYERLKARVIAQLG